MHVRSHGHWYATNRYAVGFPYSGAAENAPFYLVVDPTGVVHQTDDYGVPFASDDEAADFCRGKNRRHA